MTRQPEHTHTFTASSIDELVADALTFIVGRGGEGRADDASTMVFSGEGRTAAEALREALDDIRALGVEHRCTPGDVTTDGVMRTDAGIRVWGTIACLEGMTAALPPTEILDFDIEQENDQWMLTIRRR